MPANRFAGRRGQFEDTADVVIDTSRGVPPAATAGTVAGAEGTTVAIAGSSGDRDEGHGANSPAPSDAASASVENRRAAPSDVAPTELTPPRGPDLSDGDASIHLEELVAESLEPRPSPPSELPAVAIELVGPHLRLSGGLRIGAHRRLSDFVNHHLGLFELVDATVLRRNGEPTRVHTPSFWVLADEVTLIAQLSQQPSGGPAPEFRVSKVARAIVVVTPGHTLTGHIFITEGAELAMFLESPTPQFVPMTDVRTRSLADRRIVARYPFALLNRRHMVAATELQPGMAPGRVVL